jgi:fumarylacetoacetase
MSGGKIPPNFFHIPLAYNGRSSSIIPSPHPIRRPNGAIRVPETDAPVHEASRKLDFELEMGYFVSKPVPYGSTLSIENAAEHIFGFVLLDDWSSRDIQGFEMTPLGPFNSKCKR